MDIFKPTTADVESIYQLIKVYADQQIVLPRSQLSIYQHLQCMYVVKDKDKIVGIAGLHVIGRDLAEVRSLVIDPEYQQKGIGRLLVDHIIKESSILRVDRLISLTYQVDFFKKCGFEIVEKEALPEKVWLDCIKCPKFNHCDEIAMIKYLSEI